MNIKSLHFDIKVKWNELDTNTRVDIDPAVLDHIINDVTQDYVEIFYSGRNGKRYNLGFEVTQQRIDMLSDLVVGEGVQPVLVPKVIQENKLYEIDFKALKYPYRHLIRAFVDSECGIINIKPEQHDDLNHVLNDPLRRPSKTWKRLVSATRASTEGSGSSLYLYSDFAINDVQLEYIREPIKVFYGGYNSLDYINGDENAPNINTPPIDSDISDKYQNLLADMVVQQLARIYQEGGIFELTTEKTVNKT